MDVSLINAQIIKSEKVDSKGTELDGVIIWWPKKSTSSQPKPNVPLLTDFPSTTNKPALTLSTTTETKTISKFPAVLTSMELMKIEQTRLHGSANEISSPFFICVPQVVKGPKDQKRQYTLPSGKRVNNVREIANHFENLFSGVKIVILFCNSEFTAVGRTGAKSKRTSATYHSKPISFNIAVLPDCCTDEPIPQRSTYNFQSTYITTTVLGLSQLIQKLKINYPDSLQNLFPRPDSKR